MLSLLLVFGVGLVVFVVVVVDVGGVAVVILVAGAVVGGVSCLLG